MLFLDLKNRQSYFIYEDLTLDNIAVPNPKKDVIIKEAMVHN